MVMTNDAPNAGSKRARANTVEATALDEMRKKGLARLTEGVE